MKKRKTRTSISIPEVMLDDLDRRAREAGRARSDLVCEAISQYFASEEEKLLAEAYTEMSEESLELAREFEAAQNEVWPEW
ncbi:MAG: ribbon-helix-helix protein, CopG family [Actinomycetota bacterium]